MAYWKLLAGATTTAILDGILEAFSGEWFPEYAGKPLFGVEPLPPLDDWAVLGVPAAIYLVGRFAKKEPLETFGLGGLTYAGPMIIHHMIVRAKAYGVGPRASPSPKETSYGQLRKVSGGGLTPAPQIRKPRFH
jgi:hypothetical protein